MVQIEDTRDSSSSGSSSRRSRPKEKSQEKAYISTSPKHVKDLVLDMLQMKCFIGKYIESRFVESLHDYRDIIKIEENDPIIPILSDLHHRIRQAFPLCWPGSTLPTSLTSLNGHCFWVELVDKVFEPCHYRIINICFLKNEICFVLQPEGKVIPEVTNQEQNLTDIINTSKDLLQQQSKTLLLGAWQLLTLENIKNSATFFLLLLCTLGTGGLYLMDFLLKFMNELTKLIHALTPFAVKCLDIVQKIIGAIFILVATIWRDLMYTNQQQMIPRRNQNYIM